ncbi:MULTISPECIES: FAD-dependent oxidoreductase [Pseudomonas]|uniref:FAD-dependent oxidoreductase n=1 Tax=Pseudomonas TaxID=286 RepID=UPI00059D5BBA|nr:MULTISPECIES: FAD-dependent oxidoreductase [Pseudomonas]AMT86680.1 pyridine nucleotide-disulfide oxidoreductase [Pseudomonas koreensis]MBB4056381.1 NADPH-dependent 2,4-dienoyl-CoA reductase/sulfur reductase-like enzyme/nitrite reductase/ring-hydroxylating ferredoxin subunit [Pseudomonas koreensis]TSB51474.1 Rieske 2Fe-2S domain-containing protein [Pseudomonas sp. ef1]
MSLHRVARFADVPQDRGLQVEIGDCKIVLLRANGELRAFQGLCPHAGAPLAEGALCHGRLICPWHKAAYRAEDGGLCEPPSLDSLKRYPLELRGDEVWVDDQPLHDSHTPPADDPRTFVVVGAGAAGTACAAVLREKGFGGRIVLVDGEPDAGYDRTVLSKFVLAGEMSPKDVPPLRDEAFYQAQRIERVQGEVTSLDAPGKTLHLNNGGILRYDAAVLATGGAPNPLKLPGAGLANVFVLRSKAQAEQIINAAQPGQRAVIIGDSFIALECASALREYGLDVTVLARHAIPFAKQFGEAVGKAIRALHEEHGVKFISEHEATQILGEDKVEGVLLDNGLRLAADLVLAGVGVHPATEPFESLPREEDQSLRVDDGMRVSDGLWAIGDIATFPLSGQPTRIEHWRLAQQHARIAASNMLGGEEHYLDVPFFWTYHFGKNYDYLGHAQEWDEVEFSGEPEQPPFIGLFAKDGIVVAAVACDKQRAMALLAERMKQPLRIKEAWTLIQA